TPRGPPACVPVPQAPAGSNCYSCCCPPVCSCIWTDWIDVSYPNASHANGGDYETFENILANNPSWVCEKVENISCRAEKFPNIPIENLGQKVECSIDKGLICNNKDQTITGPIPMPVCLNYQISVCCTPNIPECLPSTTTHTTTTPSSSTVSTVSSTPTSTTTPVPTPSESPSSTTTSTTIPPSSTTTSTTVPPTSTTTVSSTVSTPGTTTTV
ncbi:MUC5B protein, partial [Thinocorus orbignyianus]|nr:MUC5B protein [Thinocorus orbignyianus]